MANKTKYIFVVGGVISGIGKGVATASIANILQSKGYKVAGIKIDQYVNVDAGTMNPVEHGEVFVTDDGIETDQDIGNYERFLDKDIYADNYITTGQIYEAVINRERNLGYGGRCVEVVPHIPEEIIRRIRKVAKKDSLDFALIEIGGTVGEYQNILFLEAARMLRLEYPKDVLFILVSYVPVPKKLGEMKTKPTQLAARALNSAGIQVDFIIGRSEYSLDEPRKRKISVFCNVNKEDVISAPDIENIYEVPLNFEKDKLGDKILNKFALKSKKKDFRKWKNLVKTIKNVDQEINIGIVGKYFGTGDFVLSDSYISVIEAVKHATWHHRKNPKIHWINSEAYEQNPNNIQELKKFDGIIVPGGYGERGVEGKIKTIEYCRKNKIPYLGLCYGMQLATIEFARNVCKLKDAHTVEINPETKYPVIDVMPEQKINLQDKHYGGTMRLGAYCCRLVKKTKAQQAYKTKDVFERHRHRYELNNDFRDILEENGLVVSGINPQKNLVEIIELENHPFFIATQFHPEFRSRPIKPHPLFREFIKACF